KTNSLMVEFNITRDGNRIFFKGSFVLAQLHRPLSLLHQTIAGAGYMDVVLDFSECESAFPAPMLAFCAQVAKLQHEGVDFSLVLPQSERLQRLFRNANWAFFLDPRQHDPSTFRGYTQLPATKFASDEEQFKAVNRIVNAILGAIPDIARKDF